MQGILSSNSIASPQLVDYRIQSAILGITTPDDFLATLGTNPCDTYTDPEENSYCLELLANSEFVGQLTDITNGLLGAFQTCASVFATGGEDYQIIINGPNNASAPYTNCTVYDRVKRHERRTFGVGENHDLTRRMLEAVEYHKSTTDAPSLGRRKSSNLRLIRKQLDTCSKTGECFETCPDCRDQQTYCGPTAAIITKAVCDSLTAVAAVGVGALVTGACTTACGPAAPACLPICIGLAGSFSGVAVSSGCELVRSSICDPLTQRCANCNSANSGICNPDSAQCCPGETGTDCGADCCCCPECFAPGGTNCECTAAPC
jgi:hypothetical protein